MNVYNYTGTNLPPVQPVGGGGGGGGAGSNPVFPVITGLPQGWAYNACWVYVMRPSRLRLRLTFAMQRQRAWPNSTG